MAVQMILKDGTAIDLESMTGKSHAVLICPTAKAFQRLYNKLTPEAIEEVTITEDGEVVSRIGGLAVAGEQCMNNDDGTVTGHFYFDAGGYIPDDYAEAGHILLGEEG